MKVSQQRQPEYWWQGNDKNMDGWPEIEGLNKEYVSRL